MGISVDITKTLGEFNLNMTFSVIAEDLEY